MGVLVQPSAFLLVFCSDFLLFFVRLPCLRLVTVPTVAGRIDFWQIPATTYVYILDNDASRKNTYNSCTVCRVSVPVRVFDVQLWRDPVVFVRPLLLPTVPLL